MFTRIVIKGGRSKAKFPGPILFARVAGQFRANSGGLPCGRYDYTVGVDEPEISTCAPLTKANFHRKEDYAPLEFVGEVDATLDQIPPPVPWTTSQVIGSPEPPAPFRVVRVFGNLDLELPICLRYVPGDGPDADCR